MRTGGCILYTCINIAPPSVGGTRLLSPWSEFWPRLERWAGATMIEGGKLKNPKNKLVVLPAVGGAQLHRTRYQHRGHSGILH